MQRDDGRQRQAARHDRGVRGLPADVSDEAGELVLLEHQHVGWRQIMRHHQHLTLLRACLVERRLHRRRRAHQAFEYPLDYLGDIVTALAQIYVFDSVELRDQRIHLLNQRPLGVAQTLFDDAHRLFRQHRVRQDQPMQIQESPKVAGRRRGQLAVQGLEFGLHFLHRRLEARYFGRNLIGLDAIVRNVQRDRGDQVRTADGDAARDGNAVQRKAHAQLRGIFMASIFGSSFQQVLFALAKFIGDQLF